MSTEQNNPHEFKALDLAAIEREARALRARALADAAASLRRSIVALFTRAGHTRTA